MKYRQADADDIGSLITARIAFLDELLDPLTEAQTQDLETMLPSYFEKHLLNDLFVFVATHQGKIVSTVFLTVFEKPMSPKFPSGKVGTLLNVYTYPEFRRRGIAKTLMEQAIEKSKSLRLDLLDLDASSDGLPLYEQMGFKRKESTFVPMILPF